MGEKRVSTKDMVVASARKKVAKERARRTRGKKEKAVR